MIFFTLIFFIYSIFMLIIVTNYRDRKQAIFLNKVNRRKTPYGNWIRHHLKLVSAGKRIKESEIQRMSKMLEDPVFVRVLDETLIAYGDDHSSHLTIMNYMLYFKNQIIHNMLKNSGRESIKHIHRVFQVGIYRIDDPEINNYLLQATESKSLYLLHNAIRSIANIGNVEVMIQALHRLSKSEIILNHKVLQDVLYHFSGDNDMLKKRLVQTVRSYSEDVKRVVIDTLRIQKYRGAKSVMFQMLMDNHEEMEVELAIIRYFGLVKYDRAFPLLIDFLLEEEWEYRAVSASSLPVYKSDESIDALLRCIGDVNWYVRINTAQTLLDYEIEDQIILEILNSGDPYAADAMEYALLLKERVVENPVREGIGVL